MPREFDALGDLSVRMKAPDRDARALRSHYENVGPRNVVGESIGRGRRHDGRLVIASGGRPEAGDRGQRNGTGTSRRPSVSGIDERIGRLTLLRWRTFRNALPRNLVDLDL